MERSHCCVRAYGCNYTEKVWNDSCQLILMIISEEGSGIGGDEGGTHFVLYSSGSQQGEVLPSIGYFPMSPDVFLVFTAARVLLVISGQRPGMLLSTLQCMGQLPQQRRI